jgi:cell division ATPase FtsA
MLPKAGDELTECLIQAYLVDFATAEKIKMLQPTRKSMTYKDILGVSHKVTPKEVRDKVDSVLEDMAEKTAEKIKELNGGKPVSAVFVVGGGGKIKGYTDKLAKHLELPAERVALRGEEVLGFVNILVDGVKKDPLLVTPIGICLNFYDQKNHFIFLQVNGERVKLYNNDKLTVFDAVLAYGLTNEDVFPRRGKDLKYTLNGKKKFIRGMAGEPALITLNGKEAGMNQAIAAGDQIEVKPSTSGEEAKALLGEVADLSSMISFDVNDMQLSCPRYASVNGELQSEFYEIQEGDKVDILNYYTLSQLMQFMDIETPHEVFVNGARASADTKIYENFKVAWIDREDIYKAQRFVTEETVEEEESSEGVTASDENKSKELSDKIQELNEEADTAEQPAPKVVGDLNITVNGKNITLTGKEEYVFVDIFDKYDFDLKNVGGTELVQRVDGVNADHFSPLHQGASVEIYWKE